MNEKNEHDSPRVLAAPTTRDADGSLSIELQLPSVVVSHVSRCCGEMRKPNAEQVAQYLSRVLDDHFREVLTPSQKLRAAEKLRRVLRALSEPWFEGPIPIHGCTDRELFRVLGGCVEFATMRRIRDKARRDGFVESSGNERGGAQVWICTEAGVTELTRLDATTRVIDDTDVATDGAGRG